MYHTCGPDGTVGADLSRPLAIYRIRISIYVFTSLVH